MNGRRKGARAELEVAGIISEWWKRLEMTARFVRMPLSGGWGERGAREGFKASGDLGTTAERFPFTVEVKRREGWNRERFFAGKASPVWAWWRQAQSQAVEANAEPMLWLRHNGDKEWVVVVREEYANKIRLKPEWHNKWDAWPARSGWKPFAFGHLLLVGLDPAQFALEAATKG